MTNDDIIRMAREAGWTGIYSEWSSPTERTSIEVPVTMEQIERFADLVAAAEREACAQVCLMPVDEIQVTDDCSEYVYKDHLDCAEAIRKRGQ